MVRLADREEAGALTALQQRAARIGFAHIFPADAPAPTFEDDLARWEYWLGSDYENGRRCYVATAYEDLVGVVLAGSDPDAPAAGHLARLYVDPDHWSEGVGTRLYHVAMDDLRARFDDATLWVLEGNTRARSWYERLGWHLTQKRKTTYEPAGIEDVQYRIELTA